MNNLCLLVLWTVVKHFSSPAHAPFHPPPILPLDLDSPSSPKFLPLHHPRRDQKDSAHQQGKRTKQLGAEIPAPGSSDEGAGDRRAGQHRETYNGEDHAHADAGLAQVGREAAETRGEERLDAAARDAIEDGPGVQPCGGGDADPAEDADAGDEARGGEDVEGAEEVGEQVGPQAADEAQAVEDEEEVEAFGVGHVEDVAAEGDEVVEGEIKADEVLFRCLC